MSAAAFYGESKPNSDPNAGQGNYYPPQSQPPSQNPGAPFGQYSSNAASTGDRDYYQGNGQGQGQGGPGYGQQGQGYNGPQYGQQPPPNVVYVEERKDSGNGGILAAFGAGAACCCCLDMCC